MGHDPGEEVDHVQERVRAGGNAHRQESVEMNLSLSLQLGWGWDSVSLQAATERAWFVVFGLAAGSKQHNLP